MATTTRVKQWGFETASNYTLLGDATIAAGVLSMTDPILPLPFDAGGWDTEPPYDENGDAKPANGVYYKAQAGGADLNVADGMLVVQAKASATGPYLFLSGRFASSVDDIHLRARSDVPSDARIRDVLAAELARVEDERILAPTLWFSAGWSYMGSALACNLVGAAGFATLRTGSASKTDSGKVVLRGLGTTNYYTVGNGGAAAAPVFYYRRTGLCGQKIAHCFTVPYGCTALGHLTIAADRTGGGTEPLDLPLQYKLDNTDPWIDLPADGDLSGVSIVPGTTRLTWRFWHTGSVGMDNANDCRYVPKVYAVFLTYEQKTPDWNEGGQLKDVLTNIKAALNADETLQGYEGWSGAQVGWTDVMNLKLYHRCGCIVEWKETTEDHRAATKEAGALVNTIDETHSVVVKACMRLDRDLEDMIIADDQLLDFAKHVAQVLRAETLGATVHSVTVKEKRPSTEYFESTEGEDEPGDILLIKEIDVEVWGKPFEAVRP